MEASLKSFSIEAKSEKAPQEMFKIVFAGCLGTLIEWYDFFIFGALATSISSKFYHTGNPTGNLIAWLAAFAVGFVFRPLGAILFGYLGDRYGRKVTFITCLLLMGSSTVLVGLMPTYDMIGPAAGILLIILRITQGMALGGEYGGACTFICEYAPPKSRGFYSSFLNVTAPLGLLTSLVVILVVRLLLGEEAFLSYGWRIPFLLSVFLIIVSYFIRRNMDESPVFAKHEADGTLSKNIFKEAFGDKRNVYYIFLALFGSVMGMACASNTSGFFAFTFMQAELHTDMITAYTVFGIALLISTPCYVIAGYLSDIYGRKIVMLSGLIMGTTTFYPCYVVLKYFGPYTNPLAPKELFISSSTYSPVGSAIVLLYMNVVFAFIYGPLSAHLVELFPARIRYTCLSVPYHIGSGVIGGLTPVFAVWIASSTGDILSGLWYPLAVMGICTATMMFLVPETKDFKI